ncbi:TRAP transporter large permease subunit [Chloroflexota bacterium]
MDWQLILVLFLGGVIVLMLTGMPVAFAFLFVCIIGTYVFYRGEVGLQHLIAGMRDSSGDFVLLPVFLFILMGEVMFHSGIASKALHAVDVWIGRVPGRVSLLAVGGGTVLSFLTGVTMASTAILGELLVPEMEKQGYKKSMTLGPILGSGGLAMMVPPSTMIVLLGTLALVPIGKLLIGIIIPGLLMAALYTAYIVIRCRLQPDIAPVYNVPPVPLSTKLITFSKYILPLGGIVFLVSGVIILGVATPSEAAATGALGMFVLVACYGQLNRQLVKKTLIGALQVSVMILMIVATAKVFSQVLAASTVLRSAIQMILALPLGPILMLVAMQVMVFLMGMFIPPTAIMMIAIPFFIPVVRALGLDPVWFLIIFCLNLEMATTTPPFGMNLFVMKGIAPKDTTMGDCYRAALPFLACDAIAMALIIIFPSIALWLPSVMN